MKFAQELDQEAVAEWKVKYLNYRLCKKKLKAVSRAIRDLHRTPTSPVFRTPQYGPAATATPSNVFSAWRRQVEDNDSKIIAPDAIGKTRTSPRTVPSSAPGRAEREPLMGTRDGRKAVSQLTRYGSIIGSPPSGPSTMPTERPPSLKLPDPAIRTSRDPKKPRKNVRIDQGEETGNSAYEAGKTISPSPDRPKFRGASIFRPRDAFASVWDASHLRRLLSIGGRVHSPGSVLDYPMDVYREVEKAQTEFFGLLDDELDKIEGFYREKEREATERLTILRDQLHVLRDRRLQDLVRARESTRQSYISEGQHDLGNDEEANSQSKKWFLANMVDQAWNSAINGKIGKRSRALEAETTPNSLGRPDDRRDYERRAKDPGIPYRTAKRKLKQALLEYYRGLELLKSYAILNRTAFRKITKKYDKTVNARPTGRYMSEKVNYAWFVKSDVLDGYIQAVEDLYARYFEAGNHKIAANKLRKATKVRDYHGGALFRCGLFLAAGTVFALQGLDSAVKILVGNNSALINQTSFLLQIYAGYFLMLLLMLFFCLACQFWTESKVNYVFIFEFDLRDHLDWRQLCELPCLFTFFLGFFLWINFSRYGSDDMYLYYPIVLITVTGLVLFCPLPTLYWRARAWFLIACWRLFWSGLYPVEFRDFFLGDMFCSTPYSMGNIELFFCLYSSHWSDTQLCNSSHSRLLGFFTALPGIWRALQCIRRFADTKNVFPHLVNCGKYSFTILYYMSLSLYRIHKTAELRALFITFASVNSVYCSIWDLVMDWSLLVPTARKPFLRDTLAYKQTWLYYLAIIIDPILRFNWIFYAIFADDVQHSAILSFIVSLSEVCRRGMWTLLRVENEHCSNVGRFRASRDVPLPFTLDTDAVADLAVDPAQIEAEAGLGQHPATPTPATPGQDSTRMTPVATSSGRSRVRTPVSTGLRLRKAESPIVRGLSVVGNMMHKAHVQDFERRRPDGRAAAGLDAESSDEEELDSTAREAQAAEADIEEEEENYEDNDDDDNSDD